MRIAAVFMSMWLASCDAGEAPLEELDAGAPIDCATAGALTLGRCVGEDGVPCDGSEATPRWDAMPSDGMLAPLVGPQGSTMFALAARARGIAPGDPDRPASRDNPVVDLRVYGEDGGEVARLGSRAPFTPSAGLEDTWETAQLFVVVDHLASALAGRTLRVEASVIDRLGATACGTLVLSTPP